MPFSLVPFFSSLFAPRLVLSPLKRPPVISFAATRRYTTLSRGCRDSVQTLSTVRRYTLTELPFPTHRRFLAFPRCTPFLGLLPRNVAERQMRCFRANEIRQSACRCRRNIEGACTHSLGNPDLRPIRFRPLIPRNFSIWQPRSRFFIPLPPRLSSNRDDSRGILADIRNSPSFQLGYLSVSA